MIISGASGSGKTVLVLEILKDLNVVYEVGIERVYFCTCTPIIGDIQCPVPVTIHEGLPTSDMWSEPNSLIIIDDQQDALSDQKQSVAMASRIAHHYKTTFIYILQSIFWGQGSSDVIRQLYLNSQYVIILSCRRGIQQVKRFIQYMFPSTWRKVLAGYEEVMSKAFSHVLFDFHPKTKPEFIMRTGILANEFTCILDIS
jgi:hypothetical protein